MKDRPLVLVVSGLPGVGKTTATHFFRRNNIPTLSMGQITGTMLLNHGRRISERNEQHIREKLRQVFGADVYAKRILEQTLPEFKNHTLIIIEGARSLAEIAYFKARLSKIQILFLESSKEIRYQRLRERKVRPLTNQEVKQRDEYEKNLGIEKIKKIADFKIKNQGTKDDFYAKLKAILLELNIYKFYD